MCCVLDDLVQYTRMSEYVWKDQDCLMKKKNNYEMVRNLKYDKWKYHMAGKVKVSTRSKQQWTLKVYQKYIRRRDIKFAVLLNIVESIISIINIISKILLILSFLAIL